jgi:lysophospholipase L1-like esterase
MLRQKNSRRTFCSNRRTFFNNLAGGAGALCIGTTAGAAAGATAGAATGNAAEHARSRNAPVPANKHGLRFLFQGDSITDGNWGAGGRRRSDRDGNHHLGHGFVFAVAARLGADFPSAGFKFFNRGYSGNRITDLEARWQRDTLALRPDVLTVLVGRNDVGAIENGAKNALDAATFERKYNALLDAVRRQNSRALFVLLAPFGYRINPAPEHRHWGHVQISDAQWAVRREQTAAFAAATQRVAAANDAIFIDTPALFEPAFRLAPAAYWFWDGIHPSVWAHELIAREWLLQVGKRLPFLC